MRFKTTTNSALAAAGNNADERVSTIVRSCDASSKRGVHVADRLSYGGRKIVGLRIRYITEFLPKMLGRAISLEHHHCDS